MLSRKRPSPIKVVRNNHDHRRDSSPSPSPASWLGLLPLPSAVLSNIRFSPLTGTRDRHLSPHGQLFMIEDMPKSQVTPTTPSQSDDGNDDENGDGDESGAEGSESDTALALDTDSDLEDLFYDDQQSSGSTEKKSGDCKSESEPLQDYVVPKIELDSLPSTDFDNIPSPDFEFLLPSDRPQDNEESRLSFMEEAVTERVDPQASEFSDCQSSPDAAETPIAQWSPASPQFPLPFTPTAPVLECQAPPGPSLRAHKLLDAEPTTPTDSKLPTTPTASSLTPTFSSSDSDGDGEANCARKTISAKTLPPGYDISSIPSPILSDDSEDVNCDSARKTRSAKTLPPGYDITKIPPPIFSDNPKVNFARKTISAKTLPPGYDVSRIPLPIFSDSSDQSSSEDDDSDSPCSTSDSTSDSESDSNSESDTESVWKGYGRPTFYYSDDSESDYTPPYPKRVAEAAPKQPHKQAGTPKVPKVPKIPKVPKVPKPVPKPIPRPPKPPRKRRAKQPAKPSKRKKGNEEIPDPLEIMRRAGKTKSVVEKLSRCEEMWQLVCKAKKGSYVCHHCPERFGSILNLAIHFDEEGMGMSARPFKCPDSTCPWSIMGFVKRSEAKRHQEVQHSKKDVRRCLYCSRIFARSDNLRRHCVLVHGVE
uniref:ARAD1C23562p n=1 Tax=Blastobotrys adeninivorans TaxID=409370 RepID=A0A060T1T8_BLAAD